MEIDDVDRYHPQAVCQKRAAFAKPFNECGMGYFKALASFPIDAGATTPVELSGYCRGSFLFTSWRTTMANAATRSVPADDHRTALFL